MPRTCTESKEPTSTPSSRSNVHLHQLAFVEREAGNFKLALDYIEQERERIGTSDWPYLAANSYELGKLNELLGNLNKALHFAKQCEMEAERTPDLVIQACAQRLLGDIHIKLQSSSKAINFYQKAKNYFDAAKHEVGREEVHDLLLNLAEAHTP